MQDFGPYSHLDTLLYGFNLGVAAWRSPRLAVGGRLVTVFSKVVSGDDEDAFLYALAGPSMQYWINDWAWLSAGAGLVMRARSVDFGPYQSSFGVGFDGRIGATLDQGTHHTFSLAIELSPIFFPNPSMVDGLSWSYGIATLVVGYQYL